MVNNIYIFTSYPPQFNHRLSSTLYNTPPITNNQCVPNITHLFVYALADNKVMESGLLWQDHINEYMWTALPQRQQG